MRLVAALAAVTALTLTTGARAVDYINWPSSEEPVFLSNGLIRFQTNLRTRDRAGEPFVVAPDGSGLRPATPAEAAAEPAPSPPGEQLSFDNPFAVGPLYLGTRILEPVAWADAGAALSPDGKTAVFGQWVGWVYSDGFTLYTVPVDGSAEPTRITPDSCTLGPSTHSALQGRCIDGTDGADHLVGVKGGDVIVAGSGNDVIRAGDGQNVIQAQWGDDDIRSGSGVDTVWGGDGNDTIRTGAGGDFVDPGPGRDVVLTGSGADHVVANDGRRDVIDCGPGDDSARVDRLDIVRHCEHVNVTRPQSEPMLGGR